MRELQPVVNRTVTLPVDIAAWLRAEAERRGVSVTRIIVEALEQARSRAEEARSA